MNERLLTIALGGNAVSPPHGDLSFAIERTVIDAAAAELAALARGGARLLIVHGNGPQVGRLLAAPTVGAPEHLDIHVAQTQGELGYLIVEALDRHLGTNGSVALVTRVLVDLNDRAFAAPTKPVGAVLPAPPPGVASAPTPDGRGWRRVIASPRPRAMLEQGAIAALLRTHHVVAGGGGGVPLAVAGDVRYAQPAVVDKDWVAALLAIGLGADRLVFVTDVPHAFDDFGHAGQAAIERMGADEARARLGRGVFAPGSMAPKVESALDFVVATGRPALITTVGAVAATLAGAAGTEIRP